MLVWNLLQCCGDADASGVSNNKLAAAYPAELLLLPPGFSFIHLFPAAPTVFFSSIPRKDPWVGIRERAVGLQRGRGMG